MTVEIDEETGVAFVRDPHGLGSSCSSARPCSMRDERGIALPMHADH